MHFPYGKKGWVKPHNEFAEVTEKLKFKDFVLKNVEWSEGGRLQWEQHEPKIHFCKFNLQKLVEAVPTESEHRKRKSTLKMYLILSQGQIETRKGLSKRHILRIRGIRGRFKTVYFI
jgi:hypothetical protein